MKYGHFQVFRCIYCDRMSGELWQPLNLPYGIFVEAMFESVATFQKKGLTRTMGFMQFYNVPGLSVSTKFFGGLIRPKNPAEL